MGQTVRLRSVIKLKYPSGGLIKRNSWQSLNPLIDYGNPRRLFDTTIPH